MVLTAQARRCLARRKVLLILLLLRLKYKNRCVKRRRRWWVRPIFERRVQHGNFYRLVSEMRAEDPEKHFNYFRMTKEQFDFLVNKVEPVLKKKSPSIRRQALPVGLKVALTLRFLASGDSMVSLSYSERVGKSTISKVIRDTCNAIWQVMREEVLPIPTEERWRQITEQSFYRWNFPNCAGSIDGKHVVIQAPDASGSKFYNYKGQHSIVLLAACDGEYCFTFVDIGAAGRQSDGGVFSHSTFGQAILSQELPLPPPINLFGHNLPCVFVADAAFPLKKNVLRPYPTTSTEPENLVFNYRLSRIRRTIENTFGILAARWRIYRKPIIASVQTVEGVVKATVCLHNWLQRLSNATRNSYCPPGLVDYEDDEGRLSLGRWRDMQMDGLIPLRGAANRYSVGAKEVRDEFRAYFVNEGAVPWQWERMHH